jgi:exodeoxyribonuclease VII small subunit
MSKLVSSANSGAEAGELSFEQALAELEKIVARMESGELSLEQALAAHKRGLELARACQQRLEAAQQQVRVLEGEVLKPLAAAAGEPAEPGGALGRDPGEGD